jgi:hypothetical protein
MTPIFMTSAAQPGCDSNYDFARDFYDFEMISSDFDLTIVTKVMIFKTRPIAPQQLTIKKSLPFRTPALPSKNQPSPELPALLRFLCLLLLNLFFPTAPG